MKERLICALAACAGVVMSVSAIPCQASGTLIVGPTIESTAGGFTFPDGTTQTTAYTGGVGGGISLSSPDSSILIGGTPTAPTARLNFTLTNAFYAPASGSVNYAPASGSTNYAPASGSANYAPAAGSANYAPAAGSPNYLAKTGDTMTGSLYLPADGLQMAGGQMVTSGGSFGYGAAPNAIALFDIAGSFTAPTYTGHLLQVDGTVKSNPNYAQAYLRGISVSPTFDLSAGYANYLVGIENYMGLKTGANVAHSVVGYHLNGEPTAGLECNVGYGISVPNQQTSLCNGRYGFYQGDGANVQYNYFASNVGIGTPFPSQALTVQGNAQISGSLSVGSLTVAANQGLNLGSGAGQPINLTVANGGSVGGAVTIAAGSAGVSTGGSGGNLALSAGNAMAQGGSGYTNAGPAGNVTINAGTGYNTVGGNVILSSGTNSPWVLAGNSFSKVSLQGGILNAGDGATLDVEGGHNTLYGSPPQLSAGGNIKLTGGNATGSYAGGNIVLQPGTGTPAGTVQVLGSLSSTGALTLPANGLQMAGNQIVTSGGSLGYGAAPKAGAYFDIAGTYLAPTYTGHLLQVDGTLKSNPSYAQAYLRGISVFPTFDLSQGYANYLVGIETYMGYKTGASVAHSVVGYNLNGVPTAGLECNVGYGISVPNQQTSLCNGRYGIYQGDGANVQYNYFASNVGIGTPFPAQALTVQGDVQASGNINASGTGTMPVYSSSGVAQAAPHMVTGSAAVNQTVVLAGSAVFSSSSSYTCTANMQASSPAVSAVGVQIVSGSSFVVYGSFAGNVNYICVGN